MRDLIILAGGYRLDTINASAVRALGLAHLFQSLGFRVVVMGKFQTPPEGARHPDGVLVEGVNCRDIRQPVAEKPCADYARSSEPLVQVVNERGAHHVLAILCYNYPARGAWSMIRMARRRGIAPILDCTEWYGWEGSRVWRNLWRLAGVEIRMRVLTRIAGNVSCASNWFRSRLPNQHTVLWPFVLDTRRSTWSRRPSPDPSRPAHLVYSGSPGVGMHKDRLQVALAALTQLFVEGYDFRASIAGITELEYLETMPEHRSQLDVLGQRVHFHGRVSHAESLALLRSADFSVFFRQPNRVSNTGFPTKLAEAATLGIPVISNPTSDIPLYLRDGENGILARSIGPEDVKDALRRAVTMPPEQRASMVAACRAQNPFDLREWQHEARDFFKNLRDGDA